MASAGPTTPGEPAPSTREGAFRCGFVAVVGRTNVGKSTILNGLVGEKVTIVSPRRQTTRRRVRGIRSTAVEQAVFVDTPGFHDPKDELGRQMVQSARGSMPDADVIVLVVDVSVPPSDLDRTIAALAVGAGKPIVVAMNKCDLLRPEHVLERSRAYADLAATDDWVLTVAKDGHNLGELWRLIARRLPIGPQLYDEDQLTDQPERLLVAELVRESAMIYLRDEVPHSVDAYVESWTERSDGLLSIAAVLIVEREGQKGIVIGQGGAMLKRIGTRARLETERLLDRHVYLALEVKTRRGWRDSIGVLRRLGYE